MQSYLIKLSREEEGHAAEDVRLGDVGVTLDDLMRVAIGGGAQDAIGRHSGGSQWASS